MSETVEYVDHDRARFGEFEVSFWGPAVTHFEGEDRCDIGQAVRCCDHADGESAQFRFPSGYVAWYTGLRRPDGSDYLPSDTVFARGEVPAGFVEAVEAALREAGQ